MSEKALSCKEVTGIEEKIESIPRAMRHMGWTVSADLMEHWLHGAAWVLPPEWKSKSSPDPRTLAPAHVNQRSVRMSWAMSYGQIKSAVTTLRGSMANGPARIVLRDRLRTVVWGPQNRVSVGSVQHTAIDLEKTCQSNYLEFGANMDTMDDLYGSIGKGTLKVALIGEATKDSSTGRVTMHVTHAGFYIKDTYDFIDFQYLGTWTKDGVLSKSQMLMNAALEGVALRWGSEPLGNIYNHDFETYRCRTGFGGDFMIYSDVHWERVDLSLDLGA
jgi:hypothetical protein